MASIKSELLKLINRFIPDIRNSFLSAIQDVVDRVVLSEMIEAIRSGDVERAFRRTGMNDAALRPITMAVERAYEQGGVLITDGFPKNLRNSDGRVIIRFDARNSRSEAWLRDQSSRLVTSIQDSTRQVIRNTMQQGMREGVNPRTVALDMVGRFDPVTKHRVGGLIGLATNQEQWVVRTQQMIEQLDPRYFKRALRDKRFDRTVAKAIREGTPLSPEIVSKIVTRYKDNTLRYRGETIGRTETISALNRADFEATQQAIDTGTITVSDVTKIWDATGDDRTRPDHLEIDGQTVQFGEPFTFPDGTQAMYPGDTSLDASAEETINCRCRFRTKIDWGASVVKKFKGKIDFGDE